MNLKPIGRQIYVNRVKLVPSDAPDTVIATPENARVRLEPLYEGVVAGFGDAVRSDVQAGETVLFGKYSLQAIDDDAGLLHELAILGIKED